MDGLGGENAIRAVSDTLGRLRTPPVRYRQPIVDKARVKKKHIECCT